MMSALGLACLTVLALPATDDQASRAHQAELARFALKHAGNPARGRSLFEEEKRASCARCHRVRGRGGEIGPDLSDVGGKLDRAGLIESVLDPSRQVVEGYRPTLLGLTNGRVVTGRIGEETAAWVALIDAEGRRHVLPRSQIAE